MKLLTKYYRANIGATIIVLLLGSICYYFMIHYILIEQLDDALKVEEQEVVDYVKEHNSLPEPSSYKDQEVSFELVANKKERKFSTINFYNKEENENIPTRQLIFSQELHGRFYAVKVLKSQEETDDLVKLILLITSGIVLVLLLVIFLVNRFLLRRLWKPFYTTLARLKEINFSGNNKLSFQETNITEFNELNQAIGIMLKQLGQEYQTLKHFTENASHEMQTPLAIINSKLDLLVQDENISEEQMGHLQSIYNVLDRLSKLNQSLLLLARIGNKQFTETENIRVDILVKEKLSQFDEMTGNGRFTPDKNIDEVNIRCNKQLFEIMLNNLLSNAIRYNIEGGTISIQLTKNELSIANHSTLPALDTGKIFQRFYRHSDTKQDGNGLGLSIVKGICDMYGFTIAYHYENGTHLFRINFTGAAN